MKLLLFLACTGGQITLDSSPERHRPVDTGIVAEVPEVLGSAPDTGPEEDIADLLYSDDAITALALALDEDAEPAS